jgi:hypothetical protein
MFFEIAITMIGMPNPDIPGPKFVRALIVLGQVRAGEEEVAVRDDILAFAKEHRTPQEVTRTIEFRKERRDLGRKDRQENVTERGARLKTHRIFYLTYFPRSASIRSIQFIEEERIWALLLPHAGNGLPGLTW